MTAETTFDGSVPAQNRVKSGPAPARPQAFRWLSQVSTFSPAIAAVTVPDRASSSLGELVARRSGGHRVACAPTAPRAGPGSRRELAP